MRECRMICALSMYEAKIAELTALVAEQIAGLTRLLDESRHAIVTRSNVETSRPEATLACERQKIFGTPS